MRRLWNDLSVSALVAGFVAVLVGFTSSVVIVFAAAQALGATPAQTTSWIWALGLGMGATSIGLSLWHRQPVLTAWSTPGAALLAGTSGFGLGEAIGAFVACGVLIMLAGADAGLRARDGPHPAGHCRGTAGWRAGALRAGRGGRGEDRAVDGVS